MESTQDKKIAAKITGKSVHVMVKANIPRKDKMLRMAKVVMERRNWSKTQFANVLGWRAKYERIDGVMEWDLGHAPMSVKRCIWMLWAIEIDPMLLRNDMFFFTWANLFRHRGSACTIEEYTDPDSQLHRDDSIGPG